MIIKKKKSSKSNKNNWLNNIYLLESKQGNRKGFHCMRKKRGIKKIVIFVLLSVLAFGNTIPYQQFVQKNKQLEIRVESQKKSNCLDVGKADWCRITLKFNYLEKGILMRACNNTR